MRLRGSRILVTGASRGIGAALLDALRREGADAIGCARTRGPELLRCDVSDPEETRALFERTGPVDALVNNAAVIHEPAPLWEIPRAEWERMLRINVLGVVDLCRLYVPPMNDRGAGVVLNLSSGWGRSAAGRQSPYCASKFAVEAISAALAQEVAPGVAVIAVNPGVVATEMLATCFETDVSGYTPPEECAESLVRLLGRADASWNGRSVDA